jgi:DNA-directed RNA polymerase I, II, and III subunit RPABC1
LSSRETLTLLHRKKEDLSDQIFVFFPDEVKVGVKTIRGYLEKMKQGSVQRAIIVVQQGLSAFAKQALGEMAPKFKLEQFIETELLVNITEHVLVPKHIKMTKEEKAELLAK